MVIFLAVTLVLLFFFREFYFLQCRVQRGIQKRTNFIFLKQKETKTVKRNGRILNSWRKSKNKIWQGWNQNGQECINYYLQGQKNSTYPRLNQGFTPLGGNLYRGGKGLNPSTLYSPTTKQRRQMMIGVAYKTPKDQPLQAWFCLKEACMNSCSSIVLVLIIKR